MYQHFLHTEYALCIERGDRIGVGSELLGVPLNNGGVQVRQELGLAWFGLVHFTEQVLNAIFH